jgi:hypothetical protein
MGKPALSARLISGTTYVDSVMPDGKASPPASFGNPMLRLEASSKSKNSAMSASRSM